MLKNSKFSIMLALMLPALLLVGFLPAGALAQCGGGDHQSMHQQHMDSSGQTGSGQMMGSGQMGSGQMGMSGQSGQMGMTNTQAPAQADPNAATPGLAPATNPPPDTSGSGQMTGMDHSGHQH